MYIESCLTWNYPINYIIKRPPKQQEYHEKRDNFLLFIKIKYHIENKKYKDSGLVFCVKVNKP